MSTPKSKGVEIKGLPKAAILRGFRSQEELGRWISRRRAQLCETAPGGLDKYGTAALAKRLKLSPSTIYRVEKAERWSDFETIAAILDALGMELALVAKSGAPALGNL
jgi:transcriptional regulator with XRE-family HTH domain